MTNRCPDCYSEDVEPAYPWGHRDGPIVGYDCNNCGWSGTL